MGRAPVPSMLETLVERAWQDYAENEIRLQKFDCREVICAALRAAKDIADGMGEEKASLFLEAVLSEDKASV